MASQAVASLSRAGARMESKDSVAEVAGHQGEIAGVSRLGRNRNARCTPTAKTGWNVGLCDFLIPFPPEALSILGCIANASGPDSLVPLPWTGIGVAM